MSDPLIEDIAHSDLVHGGARKAIYDVLGNRGFRVGVEIGVQYGQNIEALLEGNKAEKIYGVDPYDSDIGKISPIKDKSRDGEICQLMKDRLARFGDRFVHLKMTSNQALTEVPGLIDFVYLDGGKDKKTIWDDITYWFPKLRERGIMFGHDYAHISYPHIKFLVDKYFLPLGVTPSLAPNGIWWVEKTRQKYADKVSVVVPYYNTSYYLMGLLESVVKDDRIDEVVIVDDCSLPEESKILTRLATHPKIVMHRNEENQGELKTRIWGAIHAKNDWLIFLDGDNHLTKDYLDKLYMIPHWREDVIYCPDFGNKKHVHYERLDGEYLNKKSISRHIAESPYMMTMFLNTGNYFMSRSAYLSTAQKVSDTPKHEYGDIVFNNEWLKDGGYMFVVEGMRYLHFTRKNSAWREHAKEMQSRINKVLGELR